MILFVDGVADLNPRRTGGIERVKLDQEQVRRFLWLVSVQEAIRQVRSKELRLPTWR